MSAWRPVRTVLLATTALAPLGLGAVASPKDPQVVSGTATFSGLGTSNVTVTQTTDKAVVTWRQFDIGPGERLQFIQPSALAIALNRVTGGLGPSEIYGTLTANGRVFLVNPDGVMIGRGAVINTAGFLATTHDIKLNDFMAGRYNFSIPGRPDASIVNLGSITASHHGFAALVAPGVRNSGTITATLGKVGLAAGNGFTLDLYGDRLITLAVSDSVAAAVRDVATGQSLGALVKNEGRIRANGGRVELTAVTARKIVDSVINNKGVIEARSIGTRNGKIVLGVPTAQTKLAGAPAQTVKVSGSLSVAGKKKNSKGGTIEVTGENIELAGANLDASGRTGGGKVLIGGDVGGGNPLTEVAAIAQAKPEAAPVATATTVSVDAATTIDASARTTGDGGKVVVWADQTTSFAGTIKATGGAVGGNGGFVETSGHESLAYYGLVDASASHGSNGTLLLDPLNARIDIAAGVGVVTVAAIQAALASNRVMVTTRSSGSEAGDITVAAPVVWANGNELWLAAHRNVAVNANITNTGGAIVSLEADKTGTGVGTVTFGAGVQVSTSGIVRIAFNPSVNPAGSSVNTTSYVSPTENFAPNVTGGATLLTYMKVNTPADLQNVRNNLTDNYLIGRDIDMSGVTGFAPIGSVGGAFTGRIDGHDHTISNLTISSAASQVGLFGEIGANGFVFGLKLEKFNVTANATGGAKVGTLAGENNGEIREASIINSTNSVNAVAAGANTQAGGLVGVNNSQIIDSNAQVSVEIGSSSQAGGLVGRNTGTINHSSGLGTVTGGNSDLGGLVGLNSGASALITKSNATGSVNSTGSQATVGGLVGQNTVNAAITQSFAAGSVTATLDSSASYGIGGLVGLNAGTIGQAYARGAVSGGATSYAGGLVGTNTTSGTVSETYATGGVTGHSTRTGGVIGDNSSSTGVSISYWNTDTGPSVGIGTGSASTSGVTGLTTAQLTGNMPTGFNTTVWQYTSGHNSNHPHLKWEKESPPGESDPTVLEPQAPSDSPPPTTPNDAFGSGSVANLSQGLASSDSAAAIIPILLTPSSPSPRSGQTAPASSRTGTPPPVRPLRAIAGPDGERFSNVPPIGETRFLSNEVVLQVGTDIPIERVTSLAQQLGLSVIGSQSLDSISRTAFRFRITDGRSVRDVIRALEANSVVAVAQPNYRFQLVQPAATTASATRERRGDPSQYAASKLHLGEAHLVAAGKGITVAVIDSEVDKDHSELAGVIAERFNTVGAEERPHSHGTAMVGAIASRDRLLGVAPSARILAIRAFSESEHSADGTTFNIIKGIDWAVSQGARIINMSFAGPYDPSLQRALKTAHDKGVVLIGAAGNAGPKSAPLYPGADPSVIAVTATDAEDRLFRQANRGFYVAVAAPGVDILAPAPEAAYQMSTGTSIATAHVSGVVALMLERDPTLTPAAVREILESTAVDLGPKGRDTQFGWGLVSPQRALSAVALREAARKRQAPEP